MRKDNKPKWEIQKTVAAGRESLSLALEHKPELEPRLEAGTLDGLAADVPQLDALRTGRPAKVDAVRGLTGSQKDIAKRGAKWVAAIRQVVKRRSAAAGLRKAAGVGRPVQTAQAMSVARAVETILVAAKERPDEMRACGILEADLQKGQSLFAALIGASTTQDDGMGEKKNLTTGKNRLQLRVEAAVEAISSAGNLEFLESDPLLAQRFADLIPGGGGGDDDDDSPPDTPKA